jgi:hypothetical protein
LPHTCVVESHTYCVLLSPQHSFSIFCTSVDISDLTQVRAVLQVGNLSALLASIPSNRATLSMLLSPSCIVTFNECFKDTCYCNEFEQKLVYRVCVCLAMKWLDCDACTGHSLARKMHTRFWAAFSSTIAIMVPECIVCGPSRTEKKIHARKSVTDLSIITVMNIRDNIIRY